MDALVLDDADDAAVGGSPEPDAPPQRVSVGEVALLGPAVDDHDALRAGVVGLFEDTAFEHADTHGLEVARRDHPGGHLTLRRIVGQALDLERVGEAALQGVVEGDGRRLYAGQRRHLAHHVAVELLDDRPVRVVREAARVPGVRKREVGPEHVGRAEAGVHGLEVAERTHEERRSHQQHHGQPELPRHQESPHGHAGRRDAGAAVLEVGLEVQPSVLERRQDREAQTDQEGRTHREAQDRSVEARLAQGEQFRRRQGQQHLDAQRGQDDAPHGRHARHEQPLGQEAADQVGAAGPHGTQHGQFPAARRAPGQQEVGHVHAGDEKHGQNRPEEHPEGQRQVGASDVGQALHEGTPVGVGLGIFGLEVGHDARHLGLGIGQGGPIGQPPDDRGPVALPLGGGPVHADGSPELGARCGELHAGGEDAHHLVRASIHHQRATDHLRVGPELVPPEAVREDHHGRAAVGVLTRQERPAGLHLDAQDVVDARGQLGRGHPQRARARPGQDGLAGEDHAQRLEPRAPVHVVEVVRRRRRLANRARRAVVLPDDGQFLGVLVGERPQEHPLHDAEDRRAGPDPQGQREHHHRREPRRAPHRPDRQSQVPRPPLHRHPPRHPVHTLRVVGPTRFLHGLHVPEASQHLAAGFVFGPSPGHQLPDALFQMEGDLVPDIGLDHPAREDAPPHVPPVHARYPVGAAIFSTWATASAWRAQRSASRSNCRRPFRVRV